MQAERSFLLRPQRWRRALRFFQVPAVSITGFSLSVLRYFIFRRLGFTVLGIFCVSAFFSVNLPLVYCFGFFGLPYFLP